ncbi:MAG TPA: hypothetical protein VGG72_07465 [Bryobacteraceae bacterium]|jgi:hypothetical protein
MGYADSLGILSAGPLGGFTASMVVTNADGYRYVVAPMVDGYLWQGLAVNGNLNVTKYQPGYGLRYIIGKDPATPTTDYFSLGQGSPQVWEPNVYAAGTAACEIRIVKPTAIQSSTPDQHQMTVPYSRLAQARLSGRHHTHRPDNRRGPLVIFSGADRSLLTSTEGRAG